MTIFTEVTKNECINDKHLRNNEYIQFGAEQWPTCISKDCHLYCAKNDAPCCTVSLQQLNYLLLLIWKE